MTPDRRAALAFGVFLVASIGLLAVWAWPAVDHFAEARATRPAVGSGPVSADPPPPPTGPAGEPPAPAGSRAEALDQVEAAETRTLGAEEAGRRRRQRERMLDLRAEER